MAELPPPPVPAGFRGVPMLDAYTEVRRDNPNTVDRKMLYQATVHQLQIDDLSHERMEEVHFLDLLRDFDPAPDRSIVRDGEPATIILTDEGRVVDGRLERWEDREEATASKEGFAVEEADPEEDKASVGDSSSGNDTSNSEDINDEEMTSFRAAPAPEEAAAHKEDDAVEKDDANEEDEAIADESLASNDASSGSDDDDDDGKEMWELKKVMGMKDLVKAKPTMCMTDECGLVACSKWVSNHDKENPWYSCLDCQENDFGTWPEAESGELPLHHLPEENCEAIAEKCSNRDAPDMPNLPTDVSQLRGMRVLVESGAEGEIIGVRFNEEQEVHKLTISFDNGDAALEIAYPDEAEGIQLRGKAWLGVSEPIETEEEENEDAEPAAKKHAGVTTSTQTSKPTKSQRKAASREVTRPVSDDEFIDHMGEKYFASPQHQCDAIELLPGIDDSFVKGDGLLADDTLDGILLESKDTSLNEVLQPLQRMLIVLRLKCKGAISSERFMRECDQLRASVGDAWCAVADGEFASRVNLSEGLRDVRRGVTKALAILNYATLDELERQSEQNKIDRNLANRNSACVRALTSFAKFIDHEATGRKSEIVSCDSLTIVDACLISFNVDKTRREASYWEQIDYICGKAGITRSQFFLGPAIFIYCEIEIHWDKFGTPLPLLCASVYSHLELFNCTKPMTESDRALFTGNIPHTEVWVRDFIIGYSAEKKDEINRILSAFYPFLDEVGMSVGEMTNIAWRWGAAGMTPEQIAERMALKLQGLKKAQKIVRDAWTAFRNNEASPEQLDLLRRQMSGLKDVWDAHDAFRNNEASPEQLDLLRRQMSGLKDVWDAHDAFRNNEASPEQLDLLRRQMSGLMDVHDAHDAKRVGDASPEQLDLLRRNCSGLTDVHDAHDSIRNDDASKEQLELVERQLSGLNRLQDNANSAKLKIAAGNRDLLTSDEKAAVQKKYNSGLAKTMNEQRRRGDTLFVLVRCRQPGCNGTCKTSLESLEKGKGKKQIDQKTCQGSVCNGKRHRRWDKEPVEVLEVLNCSKENERALGVLERFGMTCPCEDCASKPTASSKRNTRSDSVEAPVRKKLREGLPKGTKIEVYWPSDGEYYPCVVTGRCSGGDYNILYDDGVQETLDLTSGVQEFRFI